MLCTATSCDDVHAEPMNSNSKSYILTIGENPVPEKYIVWVGTSAIESNTHDFCAAAKEHFRLEACGSDSEVIAVTTEPKTGAKLPA